MDGKLKSLIGILEEETAIYSELIELANSERDAMLTYSINDIIVCHKDRKKLIIKAKEKEEARKNLLNLLAPQKGNFSKRVTLPDLIKKASGEEAKNLEKCRKSLKELLTRYSVVNAENNNIAAKALSFINHSIKILTGYKPEDSVYSANGTLGEQEMLGYRMNREV